MKRRDALKTLVIASGGAVALPSWAFGWKAEEMKAFNTTFTEYEISIISSIVDTIIPSNGEIGGLSVGVDQFLVGLISRCYEEEFRGKIRANLYELDEAAGNAHGKVFSECERKEQEELLLAMSSDDDENDEDFFKFMKDQTVRGFETSEEVMLNYHGYVMMPGYYDGNVDVEVK
ncbi:MAG: gluconate 2-dehydrogenase subunit 3 family protein [Balneolaceae bacterium]|nr:gluconate 2-dehydrogenase subunit 3 family protein [Balneolaceae bacterium]MBO6546856.1 gluconate 2-dehydrogenase subunit 3 family protein [Balneolaceae bacterium]MBO6649216.1 gluconate 2-dehydrogenase subunit 3 family protein [Balneolaceae bacterium]